MDYELCLMHHGVKGMKWGVRRYQNKDGSLTPKGIKRYATAGYSKDAYNSNKSRVGKAYDKFTGAHKMQGEFKYADSTKAQNKARAEKYVSTEKAKDDTARKRNIKRAAIIGGSIVAAGLATYGGYKLNKFIKSKDAEIITARGKAAAEKAKADYRKAVKDHMRNARTQSNKYWYINDTFYNRNSPKSKALDAKNKAINDAWSAFTSQNSLIKGNTKPYILNPKQKQYLDPLHDDWEPTNIASRLVEEAGNNAYERTRNRERKKAYKDVRDQVFRNNFNYQSTYNPNDYRTDNRSFGTAAKNVYDYYRKKKRG